MRAGWYEKQGPSEEVIQVGEMDTPELEAGGGGIIGGLVRWRVECARAAG